MTYKNEYHSDSLMLTYLTLSAYSKSLWVRKCSP